MYFKPLRSLTFSVILGASACSITSTATAGTPMAHDAMGAIRCIGMASCAIVYAKVHRPSGYTPIPRFAR